MFQLVLLVAALAGMGCDHSGHGAGFRRPSRADRDLATGSRAHHISLSDTYRRRGAAFRDAERRSRNSPPPQRGRIFLNVAMMATLAAWRLFPNAAYAAAWGVFLAGLVQLVFIVWAAARSGLTLRIAWPRWTPEIKELPDRTWRCDFRLGQRADQSVLRQSDRELSSFWRSHGALLCRSHQPVADRTFRRSLWLRCFCPRCRPRLAKGDRAGADDVAEPLGRPRSPAHIAFRRRLFRGAARDHARIFRPWRLPSRTRRSSRRMR